MYYSNIYITCMYLWYMSNYSHYTQCAQLLDNQSKRIQNLKLEYLTFFAIKIGNTKGK